MKLFPVFIGLGSNIDAEKNLRSAATMLRERYPAIRFSSVYETAPREREDQNPFLNAVARMETDELPDTIAAFLQDIEKRLGKSPPFRFGPRTIDLDLLLYGNEVFPEKKDWPNLQSPISNPHLIIPHPRMHERRFVLESLCELIDPLKKHPALDVNWSDLKEGTSAQGCEKTDFVLP